MGNFILLLIVSAVLAAPGVIILNAMVKTHRSSH
jgi:hypothetical protein